MEYPGISTSNPPVLLSTSESTTIEVDFCLSFIGGAVIKASDVGRSVRDVAIPSRCFL